MPEDLFSELDLGEALQATLVLSFKAQGTVHKGYPAKMDTHTADEIGSVSEAGVGDKAIGVFLKDAVADEMVAVLLIGVVKVTGSGSITIGSAVKAATGGKVAAAVRTVSIPTGGTTVTSTSAQPSMTVEAGVAFGFALQTFANGDEGLIAVGMGMP